MICGTQNWGSSGNNRTVNRSGYNQLNWFDCSPYLSISFFSVSLILFATNIFVCWCAFIPLKQWNSMVHLQTLKVAAKQRKHIVWHTYSLYPLKALWIKWLLPLFFAIRFVRCFEKESVQLLKLFKATKRFRCYSSNYSWLLPSFCIRCNFKEIIHLQLEMNQRILWFTERWNISNSIQQQKLKPKSSFFSNSYCK